MEQMSLSQVCKKYHFTRRVIQGYEKEGLIKHSGKNKYGHLMYDEDEIKKIAYIRYLQLNGLTLKAISTCLKMGPGTYISASILNQSNFEHKEEIRRIKELISRNEKILDICSNAEEFKKKEDEVYEIIMEELINEKTI